MADSFKDFIVKVASQMPKWWQFRKRKEFMQSSRVQSLKPAATLIEKMDKNREEDTRLFFMNDEH